MRASSHYRSLPLLILLAVARPAAEAQWNVVTVDSTGDVGANSSLALDSAGRPHISYFEAGAAANGTIKYATYDGTAWAISTVNTGLFNPAFNFTALALDNTGRPHVSYYIAYGQTSGLYYSSYNGTTWTSSLVSNQASGVRYLSLALNGAGLPSLSYSDAFQSTLKYASYNGAAWTLSTVDSAGSSNVLGYSSLALDSTGLPRISYAYGTNPLSNALKYASYNGTAWNFTTVDTSAALVGAYTSLKLDSAGLPRISYYDQTNRDLKYASYDGSTWSISTVESLGDVGSSTSLALDSSGRPRISYYDRDNGDLKYASYDGTSWAISTVDNVGDVGSSTSLALDSSDTPWISYRDATNLDLKVATLATLAPEPECGALACFGAGFARLAPTPVRMHMVAARDQALAWSRPCLGSSASSGPPRDGALALAAR